MAGQLERDDKAAEALRGVEETGFFSRNRLIPIVIASALFMDLIDSSSLALALPTVARDFGISTTDLRLALTIYAITVAALVPASAWMAGRLGARRVFIGAMVIFLIGSVCCGLSNNLTQLVVARVFQGAGGAMMTPVGRAIMVGSVDRASIVRAMTWYTLPAILAPLVGPPLAGFLIEVASWRWIFFVNVPVGLVGMAAILRFVPPIAAEPRRPFDLSGFILCGAAILTLIGTIETGVLSGHPWPLRLLALAALVGLPAAYVRQARRSAAPLIDLRVLRHRTLASGLLGGGLLRVAIGAFTIMLPIQLQVALGLSPLAASQVPALGAIGSILARFICPFGLRLLGFRTLMIGALVFQAAATLIPISFRADTSIMLMSIFMAFFALARAMFFMAGNSLSYADVAGAEIGHASVLFSISQQLTLGFGYALGGSLIAGAGGAGDLGAYAVAYTVIALLPVAGILVTARLPKGVGEELRQRAAP